MIDEIVIDVGIFSQRVALLSKGRLCELLLARDGEGPQPGDLYLAQAGRRVAEVGGTFLAIGEAGDALLPDAAGGAGLAEGERLIVEVRRAPVEDKGARVSAKPRLPGRYLVFGPNDGASNVSTRIADAGERARLQGLAMGLADGGAGFTMRTAAAGVAQDRLRAEAERLRARWRDLQKQAAAQRRPRRLMRNGPIAQALRDHLDPGVTRIVVDCAEAAAIVQDYLEAGDRRLEYAEARGAAFLRHDIEAQIEAALARDVALPGGGFIAIEATRALTAIDVNGGGRDGAGNAQQAWFETNLAAAGEIARQIRLRGIGGQIVIDFINMKPKRNRDRVLKALRQAFAGDPGEVRIGTFSEFGLLELSRARPRPPLAERLGEDCGVCAGSGRRPSLGSLVDALLSAAVRAAAHGQTGIVEAAAAPALIAALGGTEGAAVKRLYEEFAIRLKLSPEPARAVEDFTVRNG